MTPDNALIDAARGRDPQPQALRVAAWLINAPQSTTHGDMLIGGRELRRLHAENAEQAARIAALQAELEHANQWRDLALQFDGHRMQALGHLRVMLKNPFDHCAVVVEFLEAPPLPGEAVLAERLAQLSASPSPPASMPSELEKIRQAIRDYHYALDTRQHGGEAQNKAFDAITDALGMYWQQGQEAALRNKGAAHG